MVNSRLGPPPGVAGIVESPQRKHCNKKECQTCRSVQSDTAISSVTLCQYKTPTMCKCTTMNVVYLLTCSVCQKQYVGETKRAFMIRYKEHMKDIEYKRDKPLAHHAQQHQEVAATFTPQILEVIRLNPELDSTTTVRRKREIHWIYTLRTLAPEGLNSLG